MEITKRKADHVSLALTDKTQYGIKSGFESIALLHNALPECSLASVDTSVDFLGRKISAPLMISAITGGYQKAKEINRQLAAVSQRQKIAFGLGSQRAMIEDPSTAATYKVRDVAPDIPVVANIGAAQLRTYSREQISSLVSTVEADALAIHLNPLQEVIQPNGDCDFSGVLDSIRKCVDYLDVPVIVKETGAGISADVAAKLADVGVKWIDVSGAGGTSWSKIEYARNKKAVPGFEEWGIPTVDCLLMCKGILPMIASGGVRSGIDVAKAIALGADMAAAAQPFLKALMKNRLEEEIVLWKKQLTIAMFLTGSKNISELKYAKFLLSKHF